MTIEKDAAEAMQALVGDLSAALNRHDPAAITALFSEDAFLLAPGRPMIKGHADIAQLWDNTLKQIHSTEFTLFNAKAYGATCARAVGRLTLKSEGQGAQPIICKYLLVAEKGDKGWRVESFTWNRVQAGQGGGQRRAGADNASPQNTQAMPKMGDLYSN